MSRPEHVAISVLTNAAIEAAASRRSLAEAGRTAGASARAAARQALEERVCHFALTPGSWARAEEKTAREALAIFDSTVVL